MHEPAHPRLDPFGKQFLMYFILKSVPGEGVVMDCFAKVFAQSMGFSSDQSPLFQMLLKRCKEEKWLEMGNHPVFGPVMLRRTMLGSGWVDYYGTNYDKDSTFVISEDELARKIISTCE